MRSYTYKGEITIYFRWHGNDDILRSEVVGGYSGYQAEIYGNTLRIINSFGIAIHESEVESQERGRQKAEILLANLLGAVT